MITDIFNSENNLLLEAKLKKTPSFAENNMYGLYVTYQDGFFTFLARVEGELFKVIRSSAVPELAHMWDCLTDDDCKRWKNHGITKIKARDFLFYIRGTGYDRDNIRMISVHKDYKNFINGILKDNLVPVLQEDVSQTIYFGKENDKEKESNDGLFKRKITYLCAFRVPKVSRSKTYPGVSIEASASPLATGHVTYDNPTLKDFCLVKMSCKWEDDAIRIYLDNKEELREYLQTQKS